MHCKLRTAGVDAGLHIFEAMPPAGVGGAPKDLELSGDRLASVGSRTWI